MRDVPVKGMCEARKCLISHERSGSLMQHDAAAHETPPAPSSYDDWQQRSVEERQCPACGRIMSYREWSEQHMCDECIDARGIHARVMGGRAPRFPTPAPVDRRTSSARRGRGGPTPT